MTEFFGLFQLPRCIYYSLSGEISLSDQYQEYIISRHEWAKYFPNLCDEASILIDATSTSYW